MALNTASAAVSEVCQAISNHLLPEYFHLPEDVESMREKVAEFETKCGMTQGFGCIDGTHSNWMPIRELRRFFLLQTILFTKCTGCVTIKVPL